MTCFSPFSRPDMTFAVEWALNNNYLSSPFPTVLTICWTGWQKIKLKLNQEKTEAVLIDTKTKLSFSSVQVTDCHLSSSVLPLSPSVKILGIILDNTYLMPETAHLSPHSIWLFCNSDKYRPSDTIFLKTLSQNWSPHSFCLNSTTATLSDPLWSTVIWPSRLTGR